MRKRGKALPSRPIFNEDNRGWSKLDAKRDTNISTFHDRHSTRLDSTRKQSRRVSGGKSGSRIVTRARQDAREPTFPLFCGMRVRFFTASSCRIAFIVRTRSDPLRKKKTHLHLRLFLHCSLKDLITPSNEYGLPYNYAQSRDRLPILRLSVKKKKKKSGKVFPCANLKMIDDFSPWNRVLTTARFSREEEGYSLLLYYSVPFYYSFEVGWIRRSPMGDVLKSFKVFWNYQERYRPSF